MSYVFVQFPDSRPVRVNGVNCGTTNTLFSLQSGHQTFDLGVPDDYVPTRRDLILPDNTSLDPEIIVFEKVTP